MNPLQMSPKAERGENIPAEFSIQFCILVFPEQEKDPE